MQPKSVITKTLFFTLVALFLCTNINAQNKSNKKNKNEIINLTAETYQDATKKGLVLVDYWATWCGPCKKMEPILEKIANEGKVKVAKLNVDQNKAFVSSQRINSIPTMIIYKDGKEVKRVIGAYDQDELTKILYSFL